MSRIEFNVVALGDFSSVNAQLANLRKNVAALNAQLVGVGVSSELAASMSAINNEFKATLLSSGAFTAKTVQLTAETEKFGQALQSGKLKLSQYFSIIKAGAAQSTAEMKMLAMEQAKLSNSLIVADPLKRGAFSVLTPTHINAVTNATKIATIQQNLYNMAVLKGSESLINWGKNTQWAGRQMTVGLTMPIIMFGAVAAKSFADVTSEIVRMQKVYGEGLTAPTSAELDKIAGQVKTLSRELAVSWGTAAKDTAKMAADLAATGLTGNNLVGATKEAMRLSRLGELDAGASLTTVISLQNVYKLSTDELTKSIDFLNAVENQTSTSLQDLADSIPKVGPIVKQLGGDFKDTAAMIVALKEAGVPAGQAANAIKSSLASLINPTKAAKEAFASYGIDVAGVARATGGKPVEMLQLLNREMLKLEPLARAQLIEKMFGKYQFARISALLDNMNRLGTQTQTVFGLMGATDAQLAKMSEKELNIQAQSTTGKFKIAMETIKADLVPIGEKFIKIFTIIMQGIDKFVHAFDKLGPLKNLMGILLGIGLVVGPVVMLTGVMANFIGYVAKGILGLTNFAKGGTHIKELLTAESVAAAQASDLMVKSNMKEAEVTELVTKAVAQLNIQMEQLVKLKNAAAGSVGMGIPSTAAPSRVGLFSPAGIPTSPVLNSQGNLALTNASHMQGPITTLNLAQAKLAVQTGEIAGLEVKLTETMKTNMSKIISVAESGLLSAKEKAEIEFKILGNGVVSLADTLNRQISGAGMVAKEAFLQTLRPGILAPQAALANQRGAAISTAAIAKVDTAFINMANQVANTGKKFEMIGDQNLPQLTTKVFKALEKELMSLDSAVEPLKNEMLRFVKNIQMSEKEFAILQASLGSFATTNKMIPGLTGAGMNAFGRDTAARHSSPIGVFPGVKFNSSQQRLLAKQIQEEIRMLVIAQQQAIEAGEPQVRATMTAEQKLNNKAYRDGIRQMQKEAQELIKQGVMIETKEFEMLLKARNPSLKNAWVTSAEAQAQGIREGQKIIDAAIVRSQEEEQALLAKKSKMRSRAMAGNMGLSMGLMGGSMLLSESGAKGTGADVAQGALSMGSMGAMAAMFAPTLGMMAAIVGVALAIGGLIALMKHLSDEHKKHELMVKNSMKASSTAFDIFGGKIIDNTAHIATFANATASTTEQLTKLQKNLDAIKELKDDDPFKVMANSLKTLDSTAAIGTIRQFAAAQVANGMDPSQVNDMVEALLTYAGKANLVAYAQNTIGKSTKDVQAATETWIKKLNEASIASDGVYHRYKTLVAEYSKMGTQTQALADGLLTTTLNILSSTTPMDNVIAQLNALKNSVLTTAESFHLLIQAAINANQMDLANLLTQAQQLGMTVDQAALIAKLNQSVQMPTDLTQMQSWATNPENWTKMLNEQNVKVQTLYSQQISKKTKDEQIAALQEQKKAIDKQIAAQKENTAELKRQNDFKLKKADLENQIKVAESSGDYLKANLLRQDLASAKFDLQAGNKTALELQSEALASKIEDLQSASQKIAKAMTDAATAFTKPKTKAQIDAEAASYVQFFKNSPLFSAGNYNTPLIVQIKDGKPVPANGSGTGSDGKVPMAQIQVPYANVDENGNMTPYIDTNGLLTTEGMQWVKDHATDLKKNKTYTLANKKYKYDGKKFIPQKLQTGRVEAGLPTWVGEVRPEVFIPDTNGYMINPADLQSRFSRASYNVPGMSTFSAAGIASSSTNNSASTIINNFEISHPDGSIIVDEVMRKINLQAQKSGTITKIGYEA